jgi:hypothetical protein
VFGASADRQFAAFSHSRVTVCNSGPQRVEYPAGYGYNSSMTEAGSTILIVEDDAVIRRLVSEVLRAEGFSVEAAEERSPMRSIGSWVSRPERMIIWSSPLVLASCLRGFAQCFAADRAFRPRGPGASPWGI